MNTATRVRRLRQSATLTLIYDLKGTRQQRWSASHVHTRDPEPAVLEALPVVRSLNRHVQGGQVDLQGLLPADTNSHPPSNYTDEVQLYHVNAAGKPDHATCAMFFSKERSVEEEMLRVQKHLHLKAGGTLYLVFKRDSQHGPAYLATRIRLLKETDTPQATPEPQRPRAPLVYGELITFQDGQVVRTVQH